MGLEEGLLSYTEISSSSKYESESETSTGSALPLYTSLPPPIPLPLPPYFNMSHIDFQAIIHQQHEQLAAMQVQIQALLAAEAGGAATEPHMEVAKPAIFNGEAEKVGGLISACKLYIKMRLRRESVESQIQWILSYV